MSESVVEPRFLVGGPRAGMLVRVVGDTFRIPISSGRNAVYGQPTDRLLARTELHFSHFEAAPGYDPQTLGEAIADLIDQVERSNRR